MTTSLTDAGLEAPLAEPESDRAERILTLRRRFLDQAFDTPSIQKTASHTEFLTPPRATVRRAP